VTSQERTIDGALAGPVIQALESAHDPDE